MADYAWLAYNFTTEDLQNLPLPDLNFDDYSFDMNSLDLQSLPQSSDFGQAPATSSQSTQSSCTSAGMACTDNACGCGRTFRRRSDLKKHVDQRTRPYACPHPGCTVRPFSNKHDRDRHQREVHASDGGNAHGQPVQKLRCPVVSCKRHVRGFARKENLALHVRNMHPHGMQDQVTFGNKPDASLGSRTLSSSSTSPLTAAVPLSPAETQATTLPSSAGCAATDVVLLTGLNERLFALRAQRETLARQLAGVEETIDAVTRTVKGLQGGRGVEGEGQEWENWDWMRM